MKVYIQGGDFFYRDMFHAREWLIVQDPNCADVICFTGGPDIDPAIYGHPRHPTTHVNRALDLECEQLYNANIGDKLFVGICRGGQFLNAKCGGSMYQDVSMHGIGHDATDSDGNIIPVTSSHHQMMLPTQDGEILLACLKPISTFRETWHEGEWTDPYKQTMPDIEAVWYEEQKCFCFQPHPEWVDKEHPCQQFFFDQIKKFCDAET